MPTNKDYDATPTMAYALSAYHKAGGKPGSEAWDSYVNAVNHLYTQYGKDASLQLQDAVRSISRDGNDVNAALVKYAKNTLAGSTKIDDNLRKFLTLANENPEILSKFSYGFNEKPVEGESDYVTKVRQLIKR